MSGMRSLRDALNNAEAVPEDVERWALERIAQEIEDAAAKQLQSVEDAERMLTLCEELAHLHPFTRKGLRAHVDDETLRQVRAKARKVANRSEDVNIAITTRIRGRVSHRLILATVLVCVLLLLLILRGGSCGGG